jgi:undecaprenyl-diphosphatase
MAPIRLRPFATDLAVSRACLRIANPALEQPLRVLTWLADEKIMVAAAAVFWAATRASPSRPLRREADQMLCSLLIAGVPRLGNAWDSFPSGHAMHLSAIAGSARRLVPRRWWPTLIGALGALAASRVVLLAHYPSDVVAGWGVGALINKAVGAAFKTAERAASRELAAAPPLQPH